MKNTGGQGLTGSGGRVTCPGQKENIQFRLFLEFLLEDNRLPFVVVVGPCCMAETAGETIGGGSCWLGLVNNSIISYYLLFILRE